MLRYFLSVAIILPLLFSAPPASAVEPDEILKDKKLEARARKITATLRCLKCQNQSIDDSNAGLAKDLRVLVRERLLKGDSDTEVVDYIVARYGEFVLLNPRFGTHTLILWLGPLLILLLSAFGIWRAFTKRQTTPQTQSAEKLSPEEEEKLKELLKG